MSRSRARNKKGGNCPTCGRFVHKNGTCSHCKICKSCGGIYNPDKQCPRCSIHHSHPRSRGGGDKSSYLILLPKKIHTAWHTLHGNMCVDEVVVNALYNWETLCPYLEREREDVLKGRLEKRIIGWNSLYGKNASSTDVIAVIIRQFTRLPGDRDIIRKKLDEAFKGNFISKHDYVHLCGLLDNGFAE